MPGLLAGVRTLRGSRCIDVDDTVREVHGYAKQGAAFGYTRVRGLNIQLATISTPLAAPVIGRARLRRGQHRLRGGAGRMLAQAITTARAAASRVRSSARADSALLRLGVRRYRDPSQGVVLGDRPDDQDRDRGDRQHRRPTAWTTIQYPNAIWERRHRPGGGYWVSDAEVAEVPFTAFTGTT